MDSSITAAGRALRAGDPLGALKRVALRDDPAALALRGIAMAQLEDLGRARALLRRAARGFGPGETVERARCLTAEAEVALAARDIAWPPRALAEALRTFAAHGDQSSVEPRTPCMSAALIPTTRNRTPRLSRASRNAASAELSGAV